MGLVAASDAILSEQDAVDEIAEEVLQQELDKIVEEVLEERFDLIKDSINLGAEWAQIWQSPNPGKTITDVSKKQKKLN